MRKTTLLIIILTFISLILKSQTVPVYTKKTYVAPNGTIYINKSLPIYFFVSNSPDPNATQYLLKSESTPQYSNPMYFDTEGRNTLRSPSAIDTVTKQVVIPRIDVQYQVYADGTPPISNVSFTKHNQFLSKGIHYVSDSLNISLLSEDALSGVENIYLSIDNDSYQPYTKSISLETEKEYNIKYYGVDNTGNVEKAKEIKFFPDKTPPVSKLDIKGDEYNGILSGSSFISVVAEDKIAGVKQIFVSIDDSIFKPYSHKFNTALLTQGEHKLYYFATDKVNNKENVNIYPFYIDKTPPQVIEEVLGKTFMANGKEFSAGTSKLKITSIDNKAGIKEIFYSINNAPFEKYEKPIILSGFKGNMLIKSYAVDNVGNHSSSNSSNSRKNAIPYVDLSAPWVGHAFKGPYFTDRDTVFISHKTKIILEARDEESGIQKIEYQIDSSDLTNYTIPLTLNTEGLHNFSTYGYDNTDNMTRQEFSVVVDTLGPEIFERYSTTTIGTIEIDGETLNQYPGHAVIFLSATDHKSGFESISYMLNNTIWQPYANSIKGFIKDHKNTIRIKSIDKLGNQNEKIIEFYIR